MLNGFLCLFDIHLDLLLERVRKPAQAFDSADYHFSKILQLQPLPMKDKLLSVSMSTKQFATFGISYESQNEEGVKSIGFTTFTLTTIANLLEELKVLSKFLCKFTGERLRVTV
jgi:hypothetical protein